MTLNTYLDEESSPWWSYVIGLSEYGNWWSKIVIYQTKRMNS